MTRDQAYGYTRAASLKSDFGCYALGAAADCGKVKLFVWRDRKSPCISKPCAACERTLRDLGIKHVFYTGNDNFVEEEVYV